MLCISARSSLALGALLSEHLLLVILVTLGLALLVNASTLLLAYIALELVALGSYVLVSARRCSEYSIESALKYYVLGALSSMILLIGIALYYRVLGSLVILDAVLVSSSSASSASLGLCSMLDMLLVSYSCVLSALLFKVALVPMHSWLPEIYDGASARVCALIASAPKVAQL